MALVVTQGTTVQFTAPDGKQWAYYEPIGWNKDDPNSHLHLHWLGNGETKVNEYANLNPGKIVPPTGTWNGQINLNNGTVVRMAILFLLGSQSNNVNEEARSTAQYNTAITHVIDTIQIPTAGSDAWMRFSTSAISGGPGRFYTWYVGTSYSPYRFLFRKRVILSPVQISTTTYSAMYNEGNNSYLWVIYSEKDTNGGTSPVYAKNLYRDAPGRKRVSLNYYAGHDQGLWNPWFVTTGLSTSNGGTAQSSVWRWCADPFDGDPARRLYAITPNFV